MKTISLPGPTIEIDEHFISVSIPQAGGPRVSVSLPYSPEKEAEILTRWQEMLDIFGLHLDGALEETEQRPDDTHGAQR